MNDPIDRQEAIRWVKTECNPYGAPTLDFESGKKVIEHLEQMPSAQQWISCEERLPEEEKAYLVTFACEKVGMSSWHKDTFNRGFNRGFDAYLTGVTEDGECEYFGVVAWMEKPEPWKGEEHGTSRAVLSQKPVR